MIAADLLVHQRLRVIVGQLLDRGIIAPAVRPRFDAIVASTRRLRNSVTAEIVLIVAAATVGYWIWRSAMSLHVDTWYVTLGPGGAERLTVAGWWYAFVSLTLFRFVLVRWYYRLVIWYVFLWRVVRLPLQLNPLHPDRAGGLGFLGNSVFAFLPLLLAHTAGLAGVIAGRIFHEGAKLPELQLELVGTVALVIVMVLLPLTFFVFPLGRAKREGAREYGLLGMQYVDEFRAKWLGPRRPSGEPLVGTADVQSLADLAGAHDVLREMRMLPFGKQTLLGLAIVTALPYLPLALTMVPFEELVTRVITTLL
jgi:hypothetical protein